MAAKTIMHNATVLLPFGTAASAAIDSTAVIFKTQSAYLVSFHLVWGAPSGVWTTSPNSAALTTSTSINANFTVKCSNMRQDANHNPTLWDTKAGGTLNVTTASGIKMLSFNVDVTEAFYAIFWDAGGVTGGTVACYAVAKG